MTTHTVGLSCGHTVLARHAPEGLDEHHCQYCKVTRRVVFTESADTRWYFKCRKCSRKTVVPSIWQFGPATDAKKHHNRTKHIVELYHGEQLVCVYDSNPLPQLGDSPPF